MLRQRAKFNSNRRKMSAYIMVVFYAIRGHFCLTAAQASIIPLVEQKGSLTLANDILSKLPSRNPLG